MSTVSRPKGPFTPPTGKELEWVVPSGVKLPDGRSLDGDLLAAMLLEWREIRGGAVYVERSRQRWVHISDDPWSIGGPRLEGEGNDVTAVLNHAIGRARTAGLSPADGDDNVPGNSYLAASVLLDDAAAVSLAILDRHLTGAGDLARWYVASPCDTRNCLYHGDGRSRTHRGATVEPLDYGTLTTLYWYPGLGSVETHLGAWTEIASRPADSRRPIRLPMPAALPPGVFQRPNGV